MDNPHGLSVFDTRPKFISQKERHVAQKQDEMEKFMAAGKPHDFIKYHKLPMKKMPISQKFDDTHNKLAGSAQEASQFLDKDTWIPAYLELARTMKDDFVYGKPKLNLIHRGLKPEHVNTVMGGSYQPKAVII